MAVQLPAQRVAGRVGPLRHATVLNGVRYQHPVPGCRAMVQAIKAIDAGDLEVDALQSYRIQSAGDQSSAATESN